MYQHSDLDKEDWRRLAKCLPPKLRETIDDFDKLRNYCQKTQPNKELKIFYLRKNKSLDPANRKIKEYEDGQMFCANCALTIDVFSTTKSGFLDISCIKCQKNLGNFYCSICKYIYNFEFDRIEREQIQHCSTCKCCVIVRKQGAAAIETKCPNQVALGVYHILKKHKITDLNPKNFQYKIFKQSFSGVSMFHRQKDTVDQYISSSSQDNSMGQFSSSANLSQDKEEIKELSRQNILQFQQQDKTKFRAKSQTMVSDKQKSKKMEDLLDMQSYIKPLVQFCKQPVKNDQTTWSYYEAYCKVFGNEYQRQKKTIEAKIKQIKDKQPWYLILSEALDVLDQSFLEQVSQSGRIDSILPTVNIMLKMLKYIFTLKITNADFEKNFAQHIQMAIKIIKNINSIPDHEDKIEEQWTFMRSKGQNQSNSSSNSQMLSQTQSQKSQKKQSFCELASALSVAEIAIDNAVSTERDKDQQAAYFTIHSLQKAIETVSTVLNDFQTDFLGKEKQERTQMLKKMLKNLKKANPDAQNK